MTKANFQALATMIQQMLRLELKEVKNTVTQLFVWVDTLETGHLSLEDRLFQLKTKYALQEQHLRTLYIHQEVTFNWDLRAISNRVLGREAGEVLELGRVYRIGLYGQTQGHTLQDPLI